MVVFKMGRKIRIAPNRDIGVEQEYWLFHHRLNYEFAEEIFEYQQYSEKTELNHIKLSLTQKIPPLPKRGEK